MRVLALSDIHVDYQENYVWVQKLSSADYTNDVLLLAGDVCHDPDRFKAVLAMLRKKFFMVFFIPGNHDVWLHNKDRFDSLSKYHHILNMCASLDILTQPAKADGCGAGRGVWIVPLHGWYVKPEEGQSSLFFPKKEEDRTLQMWVDNRAVKWPLFPGGASAAEHLLNMNRPCLGRHYDAPVITFSHFLPRRELIFMTAEERKRARFPLVDPQPRFNFSRVAGCSGLDDQIRKIGSAVHVYGHQHRNRHRVIDGVHYISHCLGYPRERAAGRIADVAAGPRLILAVQNDQPV